MANGGGKKTGFSSGKTGMVLRIKPAVIIYPSLMTPGIVTGDDYIQIILLGEKDKPIGVDDINWQLKITPGLDPEKSYQDKPLFKSGASQYIKIQGTYDIEDKIYETPTQFAGILDHRARKVFEEAGFKKLYIIGISNAFMKEDGIYNAFWVYSGDMQYQTMAIDPDFKAANTSRTLNHRAGDKYFPNEIHDDIIKKVLKDMNGPKIKEQGTYAFRVGPEDVDTTDTNTLEPVQAYHPLFYIKKLTYAGIGHMGDIHLSSRQNLLAKSKARVIDYAVKKEDGTFQESDLNVSPEIGGMVNICSKNLKELLDRMGTDPKIQVVLISGDLIDFIRNLYIGDIKDFDEYEPTVKQIWDRLTLKGGFKERYQKFVDSISVYSLIVDFYRRHGKPVFVVSGNHDCYREPYGIAPRIKIVGIKTNIRANEGIAADHNLTIYEAILAFGDSYREIKEETLSTTSSLFKKEEFKWFYTVFTPFSDYVARLPNQSIIGLAWGDEEDVIGGLGDWEQGGWGHLPRSDLAVSDEQLKIVEKALSYGKKTILFSHFTFVSYREEIPFSHTAEGDVEFDSGWDANKWDMGTFETNRKPMYEKYLGGKETKRKLQCVLTGHSHRKGIYSVLRVDYSGDNSIKTFATDTYQFGKLKGSGKPVEPAVIVSDSGGSVPRYNMWGEFRQWGSDNPSGTRVVFSDTGSISDISTVKTDVKPRFSVAMDYYDMQDLFSDNDDNTIITKFETKNFDVKFEQLDDVVYDFSFWLKLVPEMMAEKIYIDDLLIYSYKSKSYGWAKIQLRYGASSNTWNIPDPADRYAFRKVAARQNEGNFLAVKFAKVAGTAFDQYDYDSYWAFPIQICQEKDGDEKKYIIKRLKKSGTCSAEIPNLGWRRSHDKYK